MSTETKTESSSSAASGLTHPLAQKLQSLVHRSMKLRSTLDHRYPRVTRNLGQLKAETHDLAQSTPHSRVSTAQMFFAKEGLDLEAQQRRLSQLWLARPTMRQLATSEWSLDRVLDDQLTWLVSSSLQESTRQTTAQMHARSSRSIESEWELMKAEMVESLGTSSLQAEGKIARPGGQAALDSQLADAHAQLLHQVIATFNRARLKGQSFPICSQFRQVSLAIEARQLEVSEQKSDPEAGSGALFDELIELWDLMSHVIGEVAPDVGSTRLDRNFDCIPAPVIRRFLEAKRRRTSQAGGDPQSSDDAHEQLDFPNDRVELLFRAHSHPSTFAMRRYLCAGSLRHLEMSYMRFVRLTLADAGVDLSSFRGTTVQGMDNSNAPSIPRYTLSYLPLLVEFVCLQKDLWPAHQDGVSVYIGEGLPFWMLLFYALRCGNRAAVMELMQSSVMDGFPALHACMTHALRPADGSDSHVVPGEHLRVLPERVWRQLCSEYNTAAPHSDPFAVALYHVIGRIPLDPQSEQWVLAQCAPTSEDYLWMRLFCLWEYPRPLPSWLLTLDQTNGGGEAGGGLPSAPSSTSSSASSSQTWSRRLTLVHVQERMVQLGPRHFSSGEGEEESLLYLKVLLYTQQFERAVKFALSHSGVMAHIAVQLSIACHYYGLVHPPCTARTLTAVMSHLDSPDGADAALRASSWKQLSKVPPGGVTQLVVKAPRGPGSEVGVGNAGGGLLAARATPAALNLNIYRVVWQFVQPFLQSDPTTALQYLLSVYPLLPVVVVDTGLNGSVGMSAHDSSLTSSRAEVFPPVSSARTHVTRYTLSTECKQHRYVDVDLQVRRYLCGVELSRLLSVSRDFRRLCGVFTQSSASARESSASARESSASARGSGAAGSGRDGDLYRFLGRTTARSVIYTCAYECLNRGDWLDAVSLLLFCGRFELALRQILPRLAQVVALPPQSHPNRDAVLSTARVVSRVCHGARRTLLQQQKQQEGGGGGGGDGGSSLQQLPWVRRPGQPVWLCLAAWTDLLLQSCEVFDLFESGGSGGRGSDGGGAANVGLRALSLVQQFGLFPLSNSSSLIDACATRFYQHVPDVCKPVVMKLAETVMRLSVSAWHSLKRQLVAAVGPAVASSSIRGWKDQGLSARDALDSSTDLPGSSQQEVARLLHVLERATALCAWIGVLDHPMAALLHGQLLTLQAEMA